MKTVFAPDPNPRARSCAGGFLFACALCAAFTPAAFAGTGRLVVRVRDAESGRAIPARLVVRDSRGDYPGDRIGLTARSWPGLEAHAVFVEGEQTFELPEGMTTIVAARGPGDSSASTTAAVVAGRTVETELSLRRLVDMRKLGWVGGDAHVHMIHGENQRPTGYRDVATACRANGLDWVYVNQEYVGAGTLDLRGYEAECRKVSTDDFRMFVGGERPKSLLGHNALIGVTDPFVIPDDPPYHRAARAIHAQGGVLFAVHPTRYYPSKQDHGRWLDFPGNNLARELIFDAYAGPSFDGISVLSDEPVNPATHALWFNLLNRGFFIPAFADSDACFDRPVLSRNVPGFWRTYLQIGEGAKVEHGTLARAVREGRTMATTGPLLLFRIDGQPSGSTLAPDDRPRTVEIEVHHPFHNWTLAANVHEGRPAGVARVELIRNGVVVKAWEPREPHARVTWTVAEKEPCWYVARTLGADGRWQAAVASPIYFAAKPAAGKREPLATVVRGRVYDFRTGEEREGDVEVRRGEASLARFKAKGQFRVKMPIDAEIVVEARGARPIRKGLLLDFAPVHRFLWYLESADLGRRETLDRFEALLRRVDLEFPVGYRMPGGYIAADLDRDVAIRSVRVADGPPSPAAGSLAPAAILLDKEQVAPGDRIGLAAIFRDEGEGAVLDDARVAVEGRAYDASRPSGFGPLKPFGSVEAAWTKAVDLGHGYRAVVGSLEVPAWASAGPVGAVEIGVRSFVGGRERGHVGLLVPIGPTRRALGVTTAWPAMPLSWPDHNYGVGPFRVCGKAGRAGQPRADYRDLHLLVETDAGPFDLRPRRDAEGCPDSDDAMFADRFPDQVLDEQSHLAPREPVRAQPRIRPRDTPVIDATGR